MRMAFLFCWLMVGFAFPGLAHDHHASSGETRENLEKKIAFFKKRLEFRPHDFNYLGRLGALYLERAKVTGLHADYKKAEETFRQLLFLDGSSKTGAIGTSYALMGQHRFSEALALARHSGERLSGDPGIWALVGDIYLAMGHYLEAETFFSRLHTFEKTLASTTRMAQIAEIRGDSKNAEALYQEAIRLGEENHLPDHKVAWCRTLLGDFLMQSGRFDEAEAMYRQALEEAPGMHYTPWRMGILAEERKQYDEAHEWVEKAIALGPNLPQYEITMGYILQDQNQPEEAEKWFQGAETRILKEIESGDIGHMRELVKMWLKRDIHPKRALELARRDLNEVRQDEMASELVAWAMYRNGMAKEAMPVVDDALRPGFGSARTLLRAGIIYFHGGGQNKARYLLKLGLDRGGMVDASLKAEAEALAKKLKEMPNEVTQRFLKAREELLSKKDGQNRNEKP